MSCIDWYICINLNYIHPKVHILFICYLTSLKYGAEQKCPLLSSYSIKTKSSFITEETLIYFTFPHVFYILLQRMRWIGFLCVFTLKKERKKVIDLLISLFIRIVFIVQLLQKTWRKKIKLKKKKRLRLRFLYNIQMSFTNTTLAETKDTFPGTGF